MVAPARAQQSATVGVAPGSRVRVKAPTLVAPLVANFLEQRGDTLVVIEDGTGRGVWRFSLAQVERLEVTAGDAGMSGPHMMRGAAIGGGAGFAAGFLFASLTAPSDPARRYNRLTSSAVAGAIGAGIGALVGSRTKVERWTSVPLPGQLSITPAGRGLIVQVAFR